MKRVFVIWALKLESITNFRKSDRRALAAVQPVLLAQLALAAWSILDLFHTKVDPKYLLCHPGAEL